MSSITGLNVTTLRIGVEPVEVEVDDDNGILWTSLQTAFPGCSGMYYRQSGDPCKKSVKFDGKKFVAPGGAWNDRDYYVTLSQRCHAAGNTSNTSSYSDATKQFEKSVQAVQKMLSASGMKIDVSQFTKKRHTSSSSTASARDTASSVSSQNNPIQAIKERTDLLQSSGKELTPLEQQFLDLARISTAKDQIIDSNRQELSKLNETIENLKNDVKSYESKLAEAQEKIDNQEYQLGILKNIGSEYAESRENADNLTQKSENLEDSITNLQLKLIEMDEQNQSLKGQLETSRNEIRELSQNIQVISSAKEILAKELNQLRPFAEAAGIEEYENIPVYIQAIQENKKLHKDNENLREETVETRNAFDEIQNLQKPIFEENAKLRKKNEDLEKRFEHVDEELKCLNENWAKELRSKQEDWEEIKAEAESEVFSLREQLAHLQSILEAATREAAENARRVSELESERHEVRRLSDAVHIKTQEDLRRQVRNLSEDLREAESRIGELNNLVSSLAAEANNSRRDITDIL